MVDPAVVHRASPIQVRMVLRVEHKLARLLEEDQAAVERGVLAVCQLQRLEPMAALMSRDMVQVPAEQVLMQGILAQQEVVAAEQHLAILVVLHHLLEETVEPDDNILITLQAVTGVSVAVVAVADRLN
jgi:hypothetical protein